MIVIIQIIRRVGEPPLTLDAAQFVAYQDNGTPIAVGAEYGPAGTQAVSMVGQKDFERTLGVLGINTTVVVTELKLPRPQPGAQLITAPK